MKIKTVLIAAVLVTILTAGAAFAWGGHRGGRGGHHGGRGGHYGGRGVYFDRPYGCARYSGEPCPYYSDVPQEIRDKFAEARKTEADLRIELGKTPIDREKALSLHEKYSALMQELSDWQFKQELDRRR